MERLTEKCWRNLDPWECCGQDRFCGRGCHDLGGCTNGCIVPKLYARLAAYEDTGLEPEAVTAIKNAIMGQEISKIIEFDGIPIRRLKELAQAEKMGRLVVLPCKVGDNVYQTDGLDIYKSEVQKIVFDTDNIAFDKNAIGKTVFLTREEAEAALKKREEADNEAER